MAYTDIDKPDDYFNTVLYTGNGTGQSITGVGFQPDFVWCKRRSISGQNFLQNIVQGTNKALFSDSTSAEFTGGVDGGTSVTSFDSDGFTLGTEGGINGSGGTFASWNWLAGGTGVSNTDGSITSTVSANTTAGFSIVSYTGSGSNPTTVGHGLSQTPEMVIVKLRSGSGTDWTIWGSILGGTVGSEKIQLNLPNGKTTGLNSSWFNNTAPDSDVFTVGTQSDLNSSGSTYIGYCFHSVKGYSKFGRYTGNGDANGTFVYTGFKPAMIIAKNLDTSTDWIIKDNKRSTYNVVGEVLYPNGDYAEDASGALLDFTSNGFKLRISGASAPNVNESGATFIYMAFAENPFVTSTEIPTTAR